MIHNGKLSIHMIERKHTMLYHTQTNTWYIGQEQFKLFIASFNRCFYIFHQFLILLLYSQQLLSTSINKDVCMDTIMTYYYNWLRLLLYKRERTMDLFGQIVPILGLYNKHLLELLQSFFINVNNIFIEYHYSYKINSIVIIETSSSSSSRLSS